MGERGEGIAALEAAIVQADAARAAGPAAEATRALRRVGQRPSAPVRRATQAGATLSPRERSIAELVGAGRSNKEVAAALFLSAKTVENTLSRI